ncbi:MAG: hypothetical protein U5M23_06370 [Marinagarivorans sp.]|nr:hypothetical protein [Marinagarivorans sp.]
MTAVNLNIADQQSFLPKNHKIERYSDPKEIDATTKAMEWMR